MGDLLPSLIAGLVIVVFGTVMLIGHIDGWKRLKTNQPNDESDRAHSYARCRRRLQTSGMIVLVGVSIPVGDFLVWDLGVLMSTLFWCAVLLIVCWIAMLALGDFLSTRTHARVALGRNRQEQGELESQLAAIRDSNRNNGNQKNVD